jgi:hypothetical protein
MNEQAKWNVTTQFETTQADQSGRYVSGVQVGFQTVSGLQGSVFIPESQYNPDYVKQTIDTKVAQMEQVQKLKG